MSDQNQKSLKEALHALIDHYKLRGGYHQTRVRALWPKLFGKTISDYTSELRIRDRKLFVSIDSAPLRQELTMGREMLRRRLNEELGEDYLREVIIR